jgi:hypothetical protein
LIAPVEDAVDAWDSGRGSGFKPSVRGWNPSVFRGAKSLHILVGMLGLHRMQSTGRQLSTGNRWLGKGGWRRPNNQQNGQTDETALFSEHYSLLCFDLGSTARVNRPSAAIRVANLTQITSWFVGMRDAYILGN